MSNFATSLIPIPSSGSPIVSVSNPQITIPPPPPGGSTIVLDLSALGSPVPSVSLPSNATSSLSGSILTITLASAFTNETITINWTPADDISNPTFTVAVSNASASATTTKLTVNADISFFVTNLQSGVTLSGPTFVVTAIPAGGQVQAVDPVFFVTNTSNSFSVNGATGTITAGPGLSVNGSTVTVSTWSALDNSVVTVPFGTGSTATFTVVQSTRPAASGGTTSLTVNPGGCLVTALSSDAYLAGIDLQYQTTLPGQYGFSFDPAGLGFAGFSWPGGTPPTFITPGTGSFFTDTNTANSGPEPATFSINTNLGSIDPTIMNNPDT